MTTTSLTLNSDLDLYDLVITLVNNSVRETFENCNYTARNCSNMNDLFHHDISDLDL